jgi:hypothetical protein
VVVFREKTRQRRPLKCCNTTLWCVPITDHPKTLYKIEIEFLELEQVLNMIYCWTPKFNGYPITILKIDSFAIPKGKDFCLNKGYIFCPFRLDLTNIVVIPR